MTPQEMQSALEAIIYAADEPATLEQLCSALGAEKVEVRAALDLLVASYSTDDRGIEVRKVAGGWKYYTKPQHHDVVRRFIKSLQPPIRLTMPALETLAVIAYKQPATVPEINEIRGVNVGGVIKTLLEKRLITTAGRKEVIGRPILYRTSKQFLMRFGLSDLDELPSLKEFEQLAQAALGSDAGVAPVEPEALAEGSVQIDDDAAASEASNVPGNPDSVSSSRARPDAECPEDLDVAPARREGRGSFSSALSAENDAVAANETNARGQSIESASDDVSGEKSAEAVSSNSPAESAAESAGEASADSPETDPGDAPESDSHAKGTSA
ncbi:MAG TPA: SMC-Scp complex subunit ScpB [Candidatus Acidoferrales bacterium]|nr:SMC-Scp complex subunit ScpB [Candidatus Acidoferrales bacterium]